MPYSSEAVALTRDWTMWIGSPDDLRRLLRLVESHFESLIPAHIQSRTQYTRERLERVRKEAEQESAWASQQSGLGTAKAVLLEGANRANERALSLEKQLKQEEEKAAKEIEIQMRVQVKKGHLRTVSGTADDLTEFLSERDFSSVHWFAPGGHRLEGHSISLDADRELGMRVEVRSATPQWGLAVESDLTSELDRRTPKLRFLRNGLVLQILVTLPALLLVLLTANSLPASDRLAFSIIGAVGASFVGLFGALGIRKLIPAFELVSSGTPSRSSRSLKVVLSGIVTVGLGVLTAWVTQLVLP